MVSGFGKRKEGTRNLTHQTDQRRWYLTSRNSSIASKGFNPKPTIYTYISSWIFPPQKGQAFPFSKGFSPDTCWVSWEKVWIYLFICRCFTLGNGWGVGHLCPPPQVGQESLFQNPLLISGYVLVSGWPMAFNPLQYAFLGKIEIKRCWPILAPITMY